MDIRKCTERNLLLHGGCKIAWCKPVISVSGPLVGQVAPKIVSFNVSNWVLTIKRVWVLWENFSGNDDVGTNDNFSYGTTFTQSLSHRSFRLSESEVYYWGDTKSLSPLGMVKWCFAFVSAQEVIVSNLSLYPRKIWKSRKFLGLWNSHDCFTGYTSPSTRTRSAVSMFRVRVLD